MDVGAWLRGLGLGQYEPAFRDNDIDAEVLPELAADDLSELGVASLGHRKRLLKAIAALRADTVPASRRRGEGAAPRRTPARDARSQAERRQLTVMFVDLVGSTALSARLDPEDLRELIGAYHRRVAAGIERLGGFVAKYLGDGVLAYFGYPRAQEDDAERAIRAGLELVAAVRDLEAPAGTALRVRVGIATGLVVVGDLLGSGAAQEQAVVGETPNLAARLQGIAEPDSVVIAEGTRQLVGGLFECADLGAVEAKGFAGPVRAYRVLGVGAAASRFEAFHAAALAPLVGREEELELLLRRWEQAKGGEGRVVLLSGEPGVGKSRLLAALQERLARRAARRVCATSARRTARTARCTRSSRSSSARPGSRAAIRPRCGSTSWRRCWRRPRRPREDVALLAELLSLPPGDRYAAPPLAPQRKRERTFEALLRQIERLSDHEPGADGLRGRALDRPELARAARPRGRARGPAAGAAADHLPPRVRAALDRPAARHAPGARPPRPAGGRGARAAGRGRRRAARGTRGRDRRARRTGCRCSSRS